MDAEIQLRDKASAKDGRQAEILCVHADDHLCGGMEADRRYKGGCEKEGRQVLRRARRNQVAAEAEL